MIYFSEDLLKSRILDKFKITPHYWDICDNLNKTYSKILFCKSANDNNIIVCDGLTKNNCIGKIEVNDKKECKYYNFALNIWYTPKFHVNVYDNQYD